MHTTFIFQAIGFVLSISFPSVSARVAHRQDSGDLVCTNDPVNIGLFSNPAISYDASTFCVSLLSLTPTTSCLATITPRTTVYPSTVIVSTVTSPTIVASATVTVTETNLAFDLRKRNNEAAHAAITARAPYLDGAMKAAASLYKRQATSLNFPSILSSACLCEQIDPGTKAITCNGTTSTITDNVITYKITTIFTPVTTGVTTVTETVNMTSKINTTTLYISSSTWTVSTIPTSTATTAGLTSRTSASSTSEPVSSSSSFTGINSTTTVQTTSRSTTSPTATPTGCPGKNGTIFSSNIDTCMDYQYHCSLTYGDGDFYDAEEYYPSPEACTAVCDAENVGSQTPCLGIVWNTTSNGHSANCRQLRSTNTPIFDAASIALLIVPDPACNNVSTISSTISTTSSSNYTFSTRPTTWASHSWSGNHTYSHNYTVWSSGTGTSRPTRSTSVNSTSSSTTSRISSGLGTGTGTGTVGPIPTSNSTCPISTVSVPTTVYATMFSTITYTVDPRIGNASALTTETDFITTVYTVTVKSTVSVPASTTVTVTSTITDPVIVTSTSTVIETTTRTKTKKATSTIYVGTVTATSTTTEEDTTTLTSTATETETETDTTTVTLTSTVSAQGRHRGGWSW